MTSPETYRKNAQACLDLAQGTTDPARKAELLGMAQQWRDLAEMAERQKASLGSQHTNKEGASKS